MYFLPINISMNQNRLNVFTFFLRYDCVQSLFASFQLYSLGMTFLTRKAPNTTIAEFANNVDPDEREIRRLIGSI